MIEIKYINKVITLESIEYRIEDLSKNDDMIVTMHIMNDDYNTYYTIQAYNVTINGILQTSADMIIETLSNGQS